MSSSQAPHYLTFWGKARPREGHDRHPYHPAAYHNFDVAAVAEAVLRIRADGTRRIAGYLGVSADELSRLAVFLVALHDIGKFSRSFQAQVAEHLAGAGARPMPRQSVCGIALATQLRSSDGTQRDCARPVG